MASDEMQDQESSGLWWHDRVKQLQTLEVRGGSAISPLLASHVYKKGMSFSILRNTGEYTSEPF